MSRICSGCDQPCVSLAVSSQGLLHISSQTGLEPEDVEMKVMNCSGPVRSGTQAAWGYGSRAARGHHSHHLGCRHTCRSTRTNAPGPTLTSKTTDTAAIAPRFIPCRSCTPLHDRLPSSTDLTHWLTASDRSPHSPFPPLRAFIPALASSPANRAQPTAAEARLGSLRIAPLFFASRCSSLWLGSTRRASLRFFTCLCVSWSPLGSFCRRFTSPSITLRLLAVPYLCSAMLGPAQPAPPYFAPRVTRLRPALSPLVSSWRCASSCDSPFLTSSRLGADRLIPRLTAPRFVSHHLASLYVPRSGLGSAQLEAAQLCDPCRPPAPRSEAEPVRFHDDKTTYTGRHAA